MYLLDTNIILEFVLDQEKADDVELLFKSIEFEDFIITEFAFYSICLLLIRKKKSDLLQEMIDDLFVERGLRLVRLGPLSMSDIISVCKRFSLDFDDAYQYVAADKHDLTIVSFDSDFDRTDRGRKTPSEVLRI
ncbi:MAG: type II toxin-antitoxin system VapC family toxin [Calditrichaeota bacterium]|nr:type II toxin-antitoxin system VapC family toxin [Calditrichota bacterium]